MSFEELGLSEPILKAIRAAKYDAPTPIQQQAIPLVLAGRDVLGCAQTGSGKTAAFAMPLIDRLETERKARIADPGKGIQQGPRLPRVLVLCPTRELAVQIHDSFTRYSRRTKIRSVVIYGGVGQRPQADALRRGVDVIVATPGRLLDLMNQGIVALEGVQSVVLDEADYMLDIGFLPDIKRILSCLPKNRQTLLFSATMPPDIRRLANEQLQDPFRLNIRPNRSKAKIHQSVYHVEAKSKPAFLIQLLGSKPAGSTLVFIRTKRNADQLTRRLGQVGIRAEAIHSNKTQSMRQRTLAAFRKGTVKILVATDIAARGIDVKDISYVINYDLPENTETYTHRIGRTGRAGQSGKAITFCEQAKRGSLRRMEKALGYQIDLGAAFPTSPAGCPDSADTERPVEVETQEAPRRSRRTDANRHKPRSNSTRGKRRSKPSAVKSKTGQRWRPGKKKKTTKGEADRTGAAAASVSTEKSTSSTTDKKGGGKRRRIKSKKMSGTGSTTRPGKSSRGKSRRRSNAKGRLQKTG